MLYFVLNSTEKYIVKNIDIINKFNIIPFACILSYKCTFLPVALLVPTVLKGYLIIKNINNNVEKALTLHIPLQVPAILLCNVFLTLGIP